MSVSSVPPSTIAGRYRLLRRVGAGAMGAVYEALDLETERTRAVKLMHAHTLDRADLRERFRLEAKVAGRVQSPFLVDVLDAGVAEDGTPFLVMELLRGEDLRRRLGSAGRFSAEQALDYVEQTALAIDRVHGAGIVHRDLKPANLFLEEREHESPRVKVLDFGIARLVERAGASEATSSAGTPAYMAPEQLRGRGITGAADVYALGMIAYTFLAGAPYWEEEERQRKGDILALALVVVEGPKEPACARAARRGVVLPPAFDAWFAKVTAADPGSRFASARAAAEALAEALGVPSRLPAAAPVAASPGADGGAAALAEQTTELAAWPTDAPGSTTAPNSLQVLETRTNTTLDPPAKPATITLRRTVRRAIPWSVAGGLLSAGVAVIALTRGAGPPRPVPSQPALATPSSVLACPVFEASGVEDPAGWLGAAAAAVFCERARVLLGGSASRTLVPAELLSLPREPTDGFPEDPYAAADARARTLDEARRRAAAYVDGQVAKDGSGFRVAAVLRAAGGAEMARGEGSGRALYEAVREAMAPLTRPDLLPKASALDPVFSDWSRARDVDAALALLDVTLGMAENAGGLAAECKRCDARSADLGEMGPGERWLCAYTLGTPAPESPRMPFDPAQPAAAVARARLNHRSAREQDREVAAELHRLFEVEPSPMGRSTIAATESCLLQSSDPRRAYEVAFMAVHADPKNALGDLCAPWGQLVTMARDTGSADSTVRAMQAWAPWDSTGWSMQAQGPGGADRALAYTRRAYALTPFDTSVANGLADLLLSRGAREEARNVALTMASGDHPVYHLDGDLLLLRIEASEARFGAALSRALRAMETGPGESGWVTVLRFDVAWRAVEIAVILGRGAETADLVVERFIDPEPTPLDGNFLDVPTRIPALCARASPAVSARCFSRFRALRGRLSGGFLPDTDAFTRGAERYAAGDLPGAAQAWRPLLRQPGIFAALLPEAMAAAFDRTGDVELVDRLEAAAPASAESFNGASPALVAAARRAAAHGDRGRARALAKKVIEAWSVSDETVPAVEEMRRLVAGLR